jgi:ribosomal protein L29
MKYKELAGMPRAELEEKKKEMQMELIKSNAQIATGTVPKNPGKVSETKKTIAKINQLLKAKTEEKKE